MAVKQVDKEVYVRIYKQMIAINTAVLLNRKKIDEFKHSCSCKNNKNALLLQIMRQLKAINNRVLINQNTIGTQLVLSGKQNNKIDLNNIIMQLKLNRQNVAMNFKMVARLYKCGKYNAQTKKKLRIILKQLKKIFKNLTLTQRIVNNLLLPPITKCPSGHFCIPVRLIPGLSLELDVDPKGLTIKGTLKVFGAEVFSGTLSLTNPTLTIGGEFGLFLAELKLIGQFGDIAHGHFRIILQGRACIGPPIDFLRDCTGFNEIIYDQ
ncbi:hypothetical protein [Paenibacillus roseipurpureus]|uniref:Uncharacterized protein n=1 Tax=Paenibacillus roseopurpureus TaxID=2918901 RepID=A0AA96LQJ3_9BACL|nr:hypothetical protein [Paenibacillus sp. MBLB1832]WNR45413.1 hypothetical protein MJB10_04565 [Paenibacillus sp. MBLB1832]